MRVRTLPLRDGSELHIALEPRDGRTYLTTRRWRKDADGVWQRVGDGTAGPVGASAVRALLPAWIRRKIEEAADAATTAAPHEPTEVTP